MARRLLALVCFFLATFLVFVLFGLAFTPELPKFQDPLRQKFKDILGVLAQAFIMFYGWYRLEFGWRDDGKPRPTMRKVAGEAVPLLLGCSAMLVLLGFAFRRWI